MYTIKRQKFDSCTQKIWKMEAVLDVLAPEVDEDQPRKYTQQQLRRTSVSLQRLKILIQAFARHMATPQKMKKSPSMQKINE